MYHTERELFGKALLEGITEKFREELEESKENKICSSEHYNKISNIIGHKIRKNNNFRKRTLIAIIVAAVLLLSGCTIYIYRNEIRDFIVEIYESFIKVSYDEDGQSEGEYIKEYYALSYVPDGFELINEDKTPLMVLYEWENQSKNSLKFEQFLLDGSNFYLDNEEGYTSVIEYKEFTIYYHSTDTNYKFIWNDGYYIMVLSSSIPISEENLYQIIDGVKID